MGSVLVSLLPLVVGAAVVPLWIITVLFLLRGDGGVGKAAAFVGGATAVRLAQGVLFGFLLGTAGHTDAGGGTSAIVSTCCWSWAS